MRIFNRPRKTRWQPVVGYLLAVILSGITLGGCRSERTLTTHPVIGQVLFDDRPLAEAMVIFHPVEGDFRNLIAITTVQGEFSLTTYRANDGAPAGEYRVTVEFRDWVQEGDEQTRTGANLLPPRYASPADSGLRCTITAGENRLEPFRLTSR